MMNEVQEYARRAPRLPPLLARLKALPDLCPAAETNSAHTPQKDDDGPPAPPVVVRGGACAATGSGALSPTASPGAAPTFPAVPTLVGGKYLLTRPLDHSACHATHLHTQQSLLVKVRDAPSRTSAGRGRREGEGWRGEREGMGEGEGGWERDGGRGKGLGEEEGEGLFYSSRKGGRGRGGRGLLRIG